MTPVNQTESSNSALERLPSPLSLNIFSFLNPTSIMQIQGTSKTLACRVNEELILDETLRTINSAQFSNIDLVRISGKIIPTPRDYDRSLSMARCAKTSVNSLKGLVKSPYSSHTWKDVMEHPNSPEDLKKNLLMRLANPCHEYIRRELAESLRVSSDVLEFLSKDYSFNVKRALAKNPHTPEDALRVLAEDDDLGVRKAVAQHPHTPEDALNKLAEDPNDSVRWEVVENERTPQSLKTSILRALAQSADKHLKRNVAEHPSTPEDALEILAKDDDEYVRAASAINQAHRKAF